MARWPTRKLIDAADQGALDGFKVDRDGNLWCGWGSHGALQAVATDAGIRMLCGGSLLPGLAEVPVIEDMLNDLELQAWAQ